jgi:hypothetical protein
MCIDIDFDILMSKFTFFHAVKEHEGLRYLSLLFAILLSQDGTAISNTPPKCGTIFYSLRFRA